jgi:transcriptional regulator with XRE-family HTH domain
MPPRRGLAAARRKAGLKQEEFGRMLGETVFSRGVGLSTVSQWERGVLGIDVTHFRAIAAVLGLRVDEVSRLVDGDTLDAVTAASGGGPGAGVWEIPVAVLPWRPFTGYTGPAGVPPLLR